MKAMRICLLWLFVLFTIPAHGIFEQWLRDQTQVSKELLLQNISPSGFPGAVAASPSKQNPDYWYHWVRDAGLVMDVVVRLYQKEPAKKMYYEKLLWDFVEFSRRNQLASTLTGLGEPKFYMNGNPFNGPWGRPQNDGPALRAITLIKFANLLLEQGKEDLVRAKLYNNFISTHTVIKADLEFTSNHWRDKNYDPWEEVRGDHFYIRMVQRRALLDGFALASKLGDSSAASWYFEQARQVEIEITKHWIEKDLYITATLNRDGGIDYKSGLDSSVLLATLHGRSGVFFLPNNEMVLSTVRKLEQRFNSLYPLNKKTLPGVVIGRYPEDRYDGYDTSGEGNGWVLLTAGLAEIYYAIQEIIREDGRALITPYNFAFYRSLGVPVTRTQSVSRSNPLYSKILRALRSKGDAQLERLRYHSASGHFSEQINRHNGFMQGASDLTWSYAGFLTAAWQRED